MSEPTGQVEDRDRYNAAVQLVVVSETTSWNRFYIFLVLVTILIVSWVQLFTQQRPSDQAKFVMVLLCALGMVSSLVWAGLGQRGRDYVQKFRSIAARLEGTPPAQPDTNTKNPCTAADPKGYTPEVCRGCKWVVSIASSYNVLVVLPAILLFVFLALLVVTLVWQQPVPATPG